MSEFATTQNLNCDVKLGDGCLDARANEEAPLETNGSFAVAPQLRVRVR